MQNIEDNQNAYHMRKEFDVKKLVKEIVDNTINEFKEGSGFFDHIDERVTIPEVFEYIKDEINELNSYSADDVIVVGSGKFFKKFLECHAIHNKEWFNKLNYIQFNGSLRQIDNYPKIVMGQLKTVPFLNESALIVFIDDSYYSGITLTRINDWLHYTHGAKISVVMAAYDGSRRWDRGVKVHSIYRYFDYHDVSVFEINGGK